MSFTIALTGKGGVGKTTLSALITKWLVDNGKTPVLAVDADSNANLNEALGIEYCASVGGIRENAREEAVKLQGVSKSEFLDLQVQEALVESNGFDLVVMGRPEGPGCYCFANNVLRDVIKRLAGNYKSIVVDSEAGVEHISRRTLLQIDYLLILSDCTLRGVRTAKRVSDLASEMGTPIANRGLIINRVPNGELSEAMLQAVKDTGLDLLAVIPSDDNVALMDAGGMTVNDIPSDSFVVKSVSSFMQEIYK